MTVAAQVINNQEREASRAGRRVDTEYVVTREGRGASLLAAVLVLIFSTVVANPDLCAFQCPGKYNRAKGSFVVGIKDLDAGGCRLPCLAVWAFSTAWSQLKSQKEFSVCVWSSIRIKD